MEHSQAHTRKKGKGGSPCGCDCAACSAACARKSAPQSDDDGMPEIAVRSNVTCDLSDVCDAAAADGQSKET